jgi:hypothetical protein
MDKRWKYWLSVNEHLFWAVLFCALGLIVFALESELIVLGYIYYLVLILLGICMVWQLFAGIGQAVSDFKEFLSWKKK